ncbi:CHAT domain-containing tetratricopeptide repeat protein [Pyxidicoccus sp. MSG2]|uniref:CHAT domain-containing tetratricopeptide repeat protein n=1 Tax=Pyxidicoccus sp. MSG2 TaxID=2996790 RepID=UPI00226D801C|nr:CHAT domain-containing protein [Pyxidicoccus sp. MSG2]MCY1015049.1 CHAT domain-containing protein [Pyxidicoccus sp. MSG2]
MRQVLVWMTAVVLCCAAGAAAGEETPDARLEEAQKASNEASRLYAAGRYADAIVKGERALELREAALGGTHLDVASSLNTLAILFKAQGMYDRAEPLFNRSLAIREAALGKNHPDVAASLNNLALLYRAQGLYGRAEPLLQRALAIREAVLGKNHPDVAQSLNNLANVFKDQGMYGRARPLYARALAIREATLGKNHPEVAASLTSLANLYWAQGLYGRAEPLHQRALAIRETVLGKNHPDVAQSLNNLANLYQDQGMFGRAGSLHERALAIREAALGGSHPDVAQSLYNLANLYTEQGLYGQAEPLHDRALAIEEAAFGKNHPSVAQSLYGLARLFKEQGMYDRAEPLYERALAILEAALGKTHPEVAQSLSNLASLYREQGLYGRAEPLYERALVILEAALGKNHPEVARALHGLADLYLAQGMYGRAEPLFDRARSIREAALGKNHPDVAQSLHSLGILSSQQGMYSRAESLHMRALAIRDAALGKSHPDVALSLNQLALLRLNQNRLAEALPLFTRAFSVSEQRLRQEALGFSEARLARFLQLLRTDEERLYAVLRAHPDNLEVRRLALRAALLLKGRSVEESADISRAVYRSLGAEERDTFERLRGLRTQLASLSLQGPGSLPLTAYQQQLKVLAEQGDALEVTLARRSAPLRALAALPAPADIVNRVAAALPRDGALMEFIAYVDRPLLPGPGMPEPQLRYLALVLLPDTRIRALDLGPAGPIDLAASRLRDALANRDAASQAHAQALYQLAFQPLLPLLGKAHRLFLSPEGQLALVPFAALHDGHQFLIDAYDFTYLTSGKELLPRPDKTVPASSVVVLADPDFSAPLQAPAPSPGEASSRTERSTSVERFFSARREDLAHRDWSLVPLPGTRLEAEAIQRLLPQAQLFLGPEATKDRLLHLPAPGILHLATHGFFLQDAPALTGSRAIGNFGALGEDPLAQRPPDPLLRSGLLFAGANAPTPSTSSAPQSPPDSALVTALELAGLDLWGTQLVVLSACDTGRGDVKLGQGVYGLRRALVVAGAETVVMSLWKVDDVTTSTLMEAYYRNLLAGQGRAMALRDAMYELRRARPHPHYWAPFIAMGRETPLRLLLPGHQGAHHP